MDLARLVAAGLHHDGDGDESSQYPKEIQAQLATARAQLQAHATLSTGQAGSSGSGTYGDAEAAERHAATRAGGLTPMVVKKLPYKNIAGDHPVPRRLAGAPGASRRRHRRAEEASSSSG